MDGDRLAHDDKHPRKKRRGESKREKGPNKKKKEVMRKKKQKTDKKNDAWYKREGRGRPRAQSTTSCKKTISLRGAKEKSKRQLTQQRELARIYRKQKAPLIDQNRGSSCATPHLKDSH